MSVASDPTWHRVPGTTRMLVHPGAGRGARDLRALGGASDWRRQIADRLGFAALAALGAHRMPTADPLAWPDVSHADLSSALRTTLPGFRLLGAVQPRQRGRQRLSLLGRMAGNVVVVKLGAHDERLQREMTALELLAKNPLPGIATPTPIDGGSLDVDGQCLSYLVTTSVALRRQGPAIDVPLRTFEADLGERLSALPEPADRGDPDVDAHAALVPVHGDLTPWNLRRTSHGLALFDWEEAGWGAPGSDLECYRRASAAVRPWWSRHNEAR
jgi:hypothetical protein